ncbi:eCIS core domain-containing protein [Yinghuangia seranimata]|uniref:eCIS core domain-containing protein n=1 Tax=Yinghuangia seranimata TaxID=408067 RepID=UPI00248BC58C|nr:DUF4157 domain-containing protein [Yinghuangia seranimata]MDI2131113.1 DUF4157 domain-containing protein [Yinghuangia seranimata]
MTQTWAGPTAAEDHAGPLRRSASATATGAPSVAPPIVHHVLGSGGRPLGAAARSAVEPRFGRSFGHVRVHTDARAAESARAVDAEAYTVGHHIVFDEGRYAPHTPEGRGLLVHELTHVLQQRSGAPVGGVLPVGEPDAAEERQADANAARSGVADVAEPAQVPTVRRHTARLMRKEHTKHQKKHDAKPAKKETTEPPVPKGCRDTARACFSVSQKRAWLLGPNKSIVTSVPALGGRPHHKTPVGRFSVQSKDEHHVSSIYKAKMPFYVNFATAVGFHEGSLSTLSHGCVHLSQAAAVKFFNYLDVGDHVDVVP